MRHPALRLCGLLVCLLALLVFSGAAADSASALWPTFQSADRSNDKLRVDSSGSADGYFFAAISRQTSNRLKLRVTKDGEHLDYDLNTDAEYELFPLQLGDGRYTIELYENVPAKGAKAYASVGKITLNVELSSEQAPFLVPNQYVDYTILSECVAKADELCRGKTPKEALTAIRDFMRGNFVYDFMKAASIKAGNMGGLPDIDGSYTKRMGICQDLSSIVIAMLRTQGIPARLAIGYADSQYHAWVLVTIEGREGRYDPTADLSAINKVREYTMERFY